MTEAQPTLVGERVALRPMTRADAAAFAPVIAREESLARWWNPIDDPAAVADELLDDVTPFAVEVGGALVGWLAIDEERDDSYRRAAIDIMLAPSAQDRGLGSEALRLALDWLLGDRGHHRVTIDPAVANHRAIRAYEAVGFRPVGVLRAYERGPDGSYHDNLLMDLLAGEQRAAAPKGTFERDDEARAFGKVSDWGPAEDWSDWDGA